MRAATAFSVFFIGLAGSAGSALAQYYPPPGPGGYQPPYRATPQVVAEDDDIPTYESAPGHRNASPGVYAAPGVYEAPLPADPRYARPVPPSSVDQQAAPNTRYGRAAPIQPEMDGYTPAPPPGYISPPEYVQSQQGYVQPQQGYVQPQQGYVQPQQGYLQPQQGHVQPQQGYVNPQQGYVAPGPAQAPLDPSPGYARPMGGPYVGPNEPPVAAAPSQQLEPAPGTSYELQEAVRPPLELSPGPIQPGQTTGTVRPDPRNMVAALPADYRPETGPRKHLPPQFRRTLVDYRTKEPPGTIVIDTSSTYLYLVMPNGKAMRYGVGVGRDGFTWSGVQKVTRMAEWPDWHPPSEMIERQPYLPRFMAGGETNPMGARALYLGNTVYRIHGTNQPSTIGTFVSSGCIRLTNEDVEDLYTRVKVGTRVVVLPGGKPPTTASAIPHGQAPRSSPSASVR
ncbi:MAG: L,D-transpeptidase family protein [Xanthobacteraceae bacterium]